jgi:hypothetical protein
MAVVDRPLTPDEAAQVAAQVTAQLLTQSPPRHTVIPDPFGGETPLDISEVVEILPEDDEPSGQVFLLIAG